MSTYPTVVDDAKLAAEGTARRNAEPKIDRTTADDMAIELQNRKETLKHHEDKVAGFEMRVNQLTEQWQKITDAIAAAEKLLTARPYLRHDIAEWKRELESIEDDGNRIRKVLDGHRNCLKASKKALQPLTEKNPTGFDFEKRDRLKAEDAELAKASVQR